MGERVKAARLAAKLTQKEVAKALRVSQTTISDIETGASDDPGVLMMAGIAKLLKVTVEELTGDVVLRPLDHEPDRLAELEARTVALEAQLREALTRQSGGLEVVEDLANEQAILRSRLEAAESEIKALKRRGRGEK